MQIPVSEEQARFLDDLVRRGRYASLVDAQAAALRLLAEAMATEGHFAPLGAHIAARLKLDASRQAVMWGRRSSDRLVGDKPVEGTPRNKDE